MNALKYILSCIFILSAINAQSQVSSEKSWGINIIPSLVSPAGKSTVWLEPQNSFAFTAFLDFNMEYNSRFGIYAGIGFNYLKIDQIDYSYIEMCDFIYEPNPDIYLHYFRDEFHIASAYIPVGVNFLLFGQQNKIYLDIGLDNYIKIFSKENYLITTCSFVDVETLDFGRVELETFQFFLKGGITYARELKKSRHLKVQPNVSYSIFPVTRTTQVSTSEEARSNYLLLGLKLGYSWSS